MQIFSIKYEQIKLYNTQKITLTMKLTSFQEGKDGSNHSNQRRLEIQ